MKIDNLLNPEKSNHTRHRFFSINIAHLGWLRKFGWFSENGRNVTLLMLNKPYLG